MTRRDAVELLELAQKIPLVTHHQQYPLDDANQALADLASGNVSGAAVLQPPAERLSHHLIPETERRQTNPRPGTQPEGLPSSNAGPGCITGASGRV